MCTTFKWKLFDQIANDFRIVLHGYISFQDKLRPATTAVVHIQSERKRDVSCGFFCTFSYDRTVPCLTCWQVNFAHFSQYARFYFLIKSFILHYQINHGTIFMFFSFQMRWMHYIKNDQNKSARRMANAVRIHSKDNDAENILSIYSFCMKEKGWTKIMSFLGRKQKWTTIILTLQTYWQIEKNTCADACGLCMCVCVCVREKEISSISRFGCGNCNSEKIYDSIEKAKGRSSSVERTMNAMQMVAMHLSYSIRTRCVYNNISLFDGYSIVRMCTVDRLKCQWQKPIANV